MISTGDGVGEGGWWVSSRSGRFNVSYEDVIVVVLCALCSVLCKCRRIVSVWFNMGGFICLYLLL